MSKNLKTEAVDHLFDAILCLKDRAECYTFFEDVCTVNELFSLSQRFEVAKMLREQKLLKDLGKKYKIAGETFEDFPDEDQKFLHTFSFICMLSFDVYIKKMLIERMIDNLNEEKEASSHENTHSGKESKKTGSN